MLVSRSFLAVVLLVLTGQALAGPARLDNDAGKQLNKRVEAGDLSAEWTGRGDLPPPIKRDSELASEKTGDAKTANYWGRWPPPIKRDGEAVEKAEGSASAAWWGRWPPPIKRDETASKDKTQSTAWWGRWPPVGPIKRDGELASDKIDDAQGAWTGRIGLGSPIKRDELAADKIEDAQGAWTGRIGLGSPIKRDERKMIRKRLFVGEEQQ
ncbi:hypothetical protein JCM8547_006771 [Rhodosporidiobolus lusitaniae]